MKDKHKLPFGQIEYRHLEELVDITDIINYSVFDDWFNFNYSFQLFLDLGRRKNFFLVPTPSRWNPYYSSLFKIRNVGSLGQKMLIKPLIQKR